MQSEKIRSRCVWFYKGESLFTSSCFRQPSLCWWCQNSSGLGKKKLFDKQLYNTTLFNGYISELFFYLWWEMSYILNSVTLFLIILIIYYHVFCDRLMTFWQIVNIHTIRAHIRFVNISYTAAAFTLTYCAFNNSC